MFSKRHEPCDAPHLNPVNNNSLDRGEYDGKGEMECKHLCCTETASFVGVTSTKDGSLTEEGSTISVDVINVIKLHKLHPVITLLVDWSSTHCNLKGFVFVVIDPQTDWYGQNILTYTHPDDHVFLKQQLVPTDLETLFDVQPVLDSAGEQRPRTKEEEDLIDHKLRQDRRDITIR